MVSQLLGFFHSFEETVSLVTFFLVSVGISLFFSSARVAETYRCGTLFGTYDLENPDLKNLTASLQL
jgi:hypothetical protein